MRVPLSSPLLLLSRVQRASSSSSAARSPPRLLFYLFISFLSLFPTLFLSLSHILILFSPSLFFLFFTYSSHVNIPYSRVMSVARFSALSPKIEAFPLRGNRTLVNSRLVFRFSGLRLVIVAVVHTTFSRVPFSAMYFSCPSVKINALLSSFPLFLSLLSLPPRVLTPFPFSLALSSSPSFFSSHRPPSQRVLFSQERAYTRALMTRAEPHASPNNYRH